MDDKIAKPPQEFHIIVNTRERTVAMNVLSYEQVVSLAPNLPPLKEGMEYIVTYRHAVSPQSEGDLIEGESVTVKNGTQFVVEAGNRS